MTAKSLGLAALLLVTLLSAISAQSRSRPAAPANPPPSRPPAIASESRVPTPEPRGQAAPDSAAASSILTEFCVDCHGKGKPKGGVSVARLLDQMTPDGVAGAWEHWLAIADRLETRQMPPEDADVFPSDPQRTEAVAWIRAALDRYDAQHAGEPGRVTVRRLTSAEYAYALRDLTGIDITVGVDASSDAVGGEGFANFGDVQFVQDASVERYLEAARQVADHAVIGAGPLDFYADPGKTGLELSALNRIEQLYTTRGFRVVSGEGGRPFGFDRYGKALYAAWHYKHRVALGEPTVTVRALAAREGITGRFAEHIWDVVNRNGTGYPSRLTIDRWQALPAPGADTAAAIAQARAECDALVKSLVTWPSWFFARGDLAAGGQGDENPLVFDDTTLGVDADPGLRPRAQSSSPATRGAHPRAMDRAPVGGRAAPRRRHGPDGHLAQCSRGAAHPAAAPAGHARAGRRRPHASAGADRRDADVAIRAARRRRGAARLRHEPRRHTARARRLRDARGDVVRHRHGRG